MHRELVVVMRVGTLISALAGGLAATACSSEKSSGTPIPAGGSGSGSGAGAGFGGAGGFGAMGSGAFGGIAVDGSGAGAGGGDGGTPGPYRLPDGFTKGLFGGFKLGSAVDPNNPNVDAGGSSPDKCGTTLTGVVRDFQESHPDFEDYCCGGFEGLVANALGADKKPVYGPSGPTEYSTGAPEFDQWYRTLPGVNQAFLIQLSFEPNGNNIFTFQSDAFFPLDGAGFGDEDHEHNYHFTTELHTRFRYKGGETFNFNGDDDVFVFINGKLVIDLGGVHPALEQQVVLDDVADDLGITTGNLYDLDLFHAERHTEESNFRIDTTLEFTNCGYVVPEPPH